MIKTNKSIKNLASITPKKVIEAIESGIRVIAEERHTDTHCGTRYEDVVEINGELFRMSRAAFTKVSKVSGGVWDAEPTRFGGYESYSFNC